MLKAEIGISTVYYTRGFELISRREGTTASYYVYDGGLSVRALTNETGAVTDTLVFDAFGNETGRTGTTDNPYGFQGEEQDATGLYYLRARYMDPATGTFTTMDTYGGSLSDPMSLHKYLFANSNPVMYCDPSGHYTMTEQMLVSALIGELISSALYYVELFSTDNIQYDKPEKYIWGGLIAAMEGIIMGVAFCLLYMALAFLTTAYIAGVIFGVSGLFMSSFGILEGTDDIEKGDTALGWTKVIINAIAAIACIISLANCVVSENARNNSINEEDFTENITVRDTDEDKSTSFPKTNDVSITDKQFGKKYGEHGISDYGLSGQEGTKTYYKIITDSIDNPSQVRFGIFKNQGNCYFYLKDGNVSIVTEDGIWVTTFPLTEQGTSSYINTLPKV